MTDTIYSRPGVVEAIDVHGRPFGVPLPPPGLICGGHCSKGREQCPHTYLCMDDDWQRHVDAVPMREPDPPVDRDLQRVIAWSLVGFWSVLIWWVLS